jgi:hypothetical protein
MTAITTVLRPCSTILVSSTILLHISTTMLRSYHGQLRHHYDTTTISTETKKKKIANEMEDTTFYNKTWFVHVMKCFGSVLIYTHVVIVFSSVWRFKFSVHFCNKIYNLPFVAKLFCFSIVVLRTVRLYHAYTEVTLRLPRFFYNLSGSHVLLHF